MKFIGGLLARLMLLVSLALASVPAGAFEWVCLVGHSGASVQASPCKMACCHPEEKAHLVSAPSDCCVSKKSAEAKASARVAVCALGNFSCRCEIRFVPAVIPVTATLSKTSLDSFDIPAVLTSPNFDHLGWQLQNVEPGIIGVDSGPPVKFSRSAEQPRAPPVQLI